MQHAGKVAVSDSLTVPFVDYSAFYKTDANTYRQVLDEVCSRGDFILRSDLEQLERNIAAIQDCRYGAGVGNATDGLMLALKAAGIGTGDEVLFCSHTFVATAGAIVAAGATPIPVDIDDNALLSIESAQEFLTPATRAIVPTHLNGRVCDMRGILDFAQKHELIVIEDAAQAIGAKYYGQGAGSFGQASMVSFFPAKVLGCFGDGGIVLTNDETIYETVRMLRDHGRSRNGDIVCWGYNSRLDNIQAAVLNTKLDKLSDAIDRRREIASIYSQQLSDLDELGLPPSPVATGPYYDVFQNYELRAQQRDKLRDFLWKQGIGTHIQWGGKAVHQFEKLGFSQHLPAVEKFFEQCLLLPMHPYLADDDVLLVCDMIRKYYRT